LAQANLNNYAIAKVSGTPTSAGTFTSKVYFKGTYGGAGSSNGDPFLEIWTVNITIQPNGSESSGGDSESSGGGSTNDGNTQPPSIDLDMQAEGTGDPHYRLHIGAGKTGNPLCVTPTKFATSSLTGSGVKSEPSALKNKANNSPERFLLNINQSGQISDKTKVSSTSSGSDSDFSVVSYVPEWVRHDVNSTTEDSENIYIYCTTSKIEGLDDYRTALFYQLQDNSNEVPEIRSGIKFEIFEQTNEFIKWVCVLPKTNLSNKYVYYAIGCYRAPSADGSVRPLAAHWDDNGSPTHNTEILVFYGKRGSEWVAITNYGVNGGVGNANITQSINVYSNIPGKSGSFLSHADVQVLGCRVRGGGYIDCEIYGKYDEIGGGLAVVLRRALAGGGTFEGGSGPDHDGFGFAGEPYGITRSDLVIPQEADKTLDLFQQNKSVIKASDSAIVFGNLVPSLEGENIPEPKFFQECSEILPGFVANARVPFPWDPVDKALPNLPNGSQNPYNVNGTASFNNYFNQT
jgi:hypothetical protein